MGLFRASRVHKTIIISSRKKTQTFTVHHPLPVRYNVCVDNTTISPEPSMVQTGIATFIRECCGCRVSSVTERELRLQTLEPQSQTRSIYVPEIQGCECISCDTNVYDWADYFLFLNHRRRK